LTVQPARTDAGSSLPERPLPSSAVGSGRGWLLWATTYVVLQAGFLLVLQRLAPRFFYLDDQQAQYLPAFHWFGRNLTGGRPPLFAPELGASGNFTADPQYGVLDPAHWVVSWLVAQAENLNTAAWLLGGIPLMVLGLGVLGLLLSYRCPPALALAASLGIASSGLSLWFGSSWWPLVWTTAWLPWLWLGLATRRRTGVLVVGVAAWLLAAGGYPYALLFALATVLAQIAERAWLGGRGAVLTRELAARLAAGAGGVLIAAPTLLTALQMAPYTNRGAPDSLLGNVGDYVPNLADVLLGSSTLTPDIEHYGGALVFAPIAATAAFAVPAAALVAWRQVVRRPGVLTAAVLLAVAVLATQLPSYVGPFQTPWRFLNEVQLYLPVLVALGLTAGVKLTRRRLGAAAGIATLQFALAVSRAPVQGGWHLVTLTVLLLAVVCLAVRAGAAADRRPVALVASAGLVLTSLLAGVVAERGATAVQALREVRAGEALSGQPARSMLSRPTWGTTLAEFRAQALVTSDDPTVMSWDPELSGEAGGWPTGALVGNANLSADLQPGYGYRASGHERWGDRGCLLNMGMYNPFAPCVEGLLAPVPDTGGMPWVDLLVSGEVLLSPGAPQVVRAHFDRTWSPAGQVRGYTRYLRREPLPGRVTAVLGDLQVQDAGGSGTALGRGGQVLDTYRVSSGTGGRLLLRVPWWPGLTASVDGEPVEVSSVDRTVTAVRLQPGLDKAVLRLGFAPVGERLLPAALTAGTLVVLVATVLAAPARPRPGRRSQRPGPDPVHASAEP
jgi:hypothetical protein